MRIGAIDIGSNSTRLLLADVTGGGVDEISRESLVTRLGDGVDESGMLNDSAIERVRAAIQKYAADAAKAGCERIGAIATSAVREAGNGADFAAQVEADFSIPVAVIGGDREAELTFIGASSGELIGTCGRTVVVDIGGGSTELIIGDQGKLVFHSSTRLGAVRQSERHLLADPPSAEQLRATSAEARAIIEAAVPDRWRRGCSKGIAVAGTPTVLAAVDQALAVFDPWKVHGYAITRAAAESLLDRLAALPLAERRAVVGLHPDRAPTIVAGAAILLAAMEVFELEELIVSEQDILYGLALGLAG